MNKFKICLTTFILVSMICILFTSCGEKEASRPDLNYDYQCTAEISSSNNSYTAMFIKQSGVWTVTFSSPETLNGMTITYENEQCLISYRDLSFLSSRDNVPVTAVSTLVTKSLDFFAGNSAASFSSKDNKITATGIMDGGDVEMIFSSSGIPSQLTIEGNNLAVRFTDFEKL